MEDKVQIAQRIILAKEELSATDYQALKHADGVLSDEEYEPIRQHRMELRKLINELETKL